MQPRHHLPVNVSVTPPPAAGRPPNAGPRRSTSTLALVRSTRASHPASPRPHRGSPAGEPTAPADDRTTVCGPSVPTDQLTRNRLGCSVHRTASTAIGISRIARFSADGPVPRPCGPIAGTLPQFDTQRHHRDVAEPFEFEVDQPQRLVDPDTDGCAACQHRRDHRPGFPKRRRQQHIGHADTKRMPCIGEVALRIDQRGYRGPVVECHSQLHRPRPGHAALVADGQHADRTVSARPSLAGRRPQEPGDATVRLQILWQHRTFQHQAGQRCAPAQRHIKLARREHAAGEVDDQPVQRLALALMDGDRPGKLERQLGERADDLAAEASRRRRQGGWPPR